MGHFIKRFSNGYAEYLHKNLTWVNPMTHRKDVLICLEYNKVRDLVAQLREFDHTVTFTNGIKEKMPIL